MAYEINDSSHLRPPWVTIGIACLCWAVFVVAWFDCWRTNRAGLAGAYGLVEICTESLVATGGMALGRIWVDGQWWRVATTALVHGSWIHLILNTWSIWVVGPWVERSLGRGPMAVIFVGSSVAGSLAAAAWADAAVVVGASAGVLGLAVALWVIRMWGNGHAAAAVEPVSARGLGVMLAVLGVAGFAVPRVAQAGHLGGMLVGGLFGAAWLTTRPRWRMAARVGVGVAVAALGVGASFATARPGYAEIVGLRHLEVGRYREAAQQFEIALKRSPGDAAMQNRVAYAYAESDVELVRALRLVDAALAQAPMNADYLDTRGWILCRQGRVDEGLRVLETAEAASEGDILEIGDHRTRCAHLADRDSGRR